MAAFRVIRKAAEVLDAPALVVPEIRIVPSRILFKVELYIHRVNRECSLMSSRYEEGGRRQTRTRIQNWCQFLK